MKITKMLCFSEEELDKLAQIGYFLKSVKEQFINKDIDILDKDSAGLIQALSDTCGVILGYNAGAVIADQSVVSDTIAE